MKKAKLKILSEKIKSILGGYTIIIEKGGFVDIRGTLRVGKGTQIVVRKDAKLIIGDNCIFQERSYVVIGGEVYIGDNCNFSHNLNIHVPSNSRLDVGNDVLVSYNVTIRTTDGHLIYDMSSRKVLSHNMRTCVVIEDHVWIGAGSTLLYGAYIGKNSVIGAASFVKKRVPSNSIAVGNPMRVIRDNINWASSIKSNRRRLLF